MAMEVKAGKSVKSRSLQEVMKGSLEQVRPVLISFEKLGIEKGVTMIPFYLLERWKELVK